MNFYIYLFCRTEGVSTLYTRYFIVPRTRTLYFRKLLLTQRKSKSALIARIKHSSKVIHLIIHITSVLKFFN